MNAKKFYKNPSTNYGNWKFQFETLKSSDIMHIVSHADSSNENEKELQKMNGKFRGIPNVMRVW